MNGTVITKDKWKELFHSNKLIDFDSFISEKDFFQEITKEKSGAVYKLSFDNGLNFFLKIKFREQKRKIIRSVLRGNVYTPPIINEVKNTEYLQAMKFNTANIAAWGYTKSLGITQVSFIITEEVKGKEFIDLYDESNEVFRQKMYFEYGKLLGQLHYNKIDSYVRIQDIICQTPCDKELELTLIDREVGSLNTKNMTLAKLSNSLSRIFYEVLKRYFRIPLSSKEGLAFCKAYLEANSSMKTTPKELYRKILKEINRFIIKRKSFSKLKQFLPRKLLQEIDSPKMRKCS